MKKCSKCGREFETRESLDSHKGLIHVQEEPYALKRVLKKLYLEEGMTIRDIGEKFSVSSSTILYHLKNHDIDRRDKSHRVNIPCNTNHVSLSEESKNFLEGLVLGDGAIYRHGWTSSRYKHSDSSREYIEWLSGKFEKFDIKQSGRIGRYSGGKGTVYKYESLSYPKLNELREKCYEGGKKIIPSDFEITPTAVFNWYIGDGCLYTNRSCRLDSYTFSREKLGKIVGQLGEVGIEVSLNIRGKYMGIYIPVSSSIEFFEYITRSNLRPPSYSYKFYEPFRSELYT